MSGSNLRGGLRKAGIPALIFVLVLAWELASAAERTYILLAVPVLVLLSNTALAILGATLAAGMIVFTWTTPGGSIGALFIAGAISGAVLARRGHAWRRIDPAWRDRTPGMWNGAAVACYFVAAWIVITVVFARSPSVSGLVLSFGYMALGRRLRVSSRPQRTKSTAAADTALLVAGIALAAIVLEVGAEHLLDIPRPPRPSDEIYVADDRCLWVPRPFVDTDEVFVTPRSEPTKQFRIQHSSQTLRGPELPARKAPGEFRIALLGDSQMYGWGVNFEDTIGSQLETLAERAGAATVTAINLGVPGYSPWQEYERLRRYGLQFEPDLVVLQLFPANDVPDTLVKHGETLESFPEERVADILRWRGHARWTNRWERNLRTYSAFYNAYRDRLPDWRGLVEVVQHSGLFPWGVQEVQIVRSSKRDWWLEANLKHSYPLLERAWSEYERDILEIVALCRAHGIPLIVYTLPQGIVTDAAWQHAIQGSLENSGEDVEYLPYKDTRDSDALLKANNLNWIPMLDAMLELDDPERLYYPRDGHLREAGCKFVAERILEYIVRNGLLPNLAPRRAMSVPVEED